MNIKLVRFALLFVITLTLPALAQQEKLGKVSFPTSCDPKVQAQFERGVAMLHSFWFSATEKTFRDVLAQDPSCGIANWGIAAILMSNPLRPGSVPKKCGICAGRNRTRTPCQPQDSARARLHRGRRRVLSGFFDPLRTFAPGVARQGV